MIIKSIIIEMEKTQGESDLTPESKQISFKDKQWNCSHPLWNKDVKLMGILRQIIIDFNSENKS